MNSFSKLSEAGRDLDWVIKVVNSSKTKDQLEIGLKCFTLWSEKFKICSSKKKEFSAINYLEEKFWTTYKNKEQFF